MYALACSESRPGVAATSPQLGYLCNCHSISDIVGRRYCAVYTRLTQILNWRLSFAPLVHIWGKRTTRFEHASACLTKHLLLAFQGPDCILHCVNKDPSWRIEGRNNCASAPLHFNLSWMRSRLTRYRSCLLCAHLSDAHSGPQSLHSINRM